MNIKQTFNFFLKKKKKNFNNNGLNIVYYPELKINL